MCDVKLYLFLDILQCLSHYWTCPGSADSATLLVAPADGLQYLLAPGHQVRCGKETLWGRKRYLCLKVHFTHRQGQWFSISDFTRFQFQQKKKSVL